MLNQSCRAFYESWQMECCGTPFSIGSRVRWQVRKWTEEGEILSAVELGPVDYIYDAHSDHYDPVHHRWPDLLILEGTVEGIQHLYERFQPSEENPHFLIATEGVLVEAEQAEGFEEKRGDMVISGYLVSLVEITVSPYQGNETVDVRNSGKRPG